MKNRSTVTGLVPKVVLAVVLATIGVQAYAGCKWYDAGCKAREAYDRTKRAAEDAANQARQAAEAAAQQAAQQAEAARQEAARVAAAAQAAATAEANRVASLAQKGAAISTSEMNGLVTGMRTVYADSTGAVTSGYNSAVNKLTSLLNSALEAIWRAAGKTFLDKNAQLVRDMKRRAQSLDANGQAALNRVKRAIGAKNIDEQARADMQMLVNAIVYGANNIGKAVTRSSFGIQVCDSGGVGNVGAGYCTMMIMQTFLEDGKFKVGMARSLGVAASPAPTILGADQTFGIFWGPGGIDEATGPSFGFSFGAVLEEGLEVGLSWAVPTTMPEPSAVVPGLSVSIGAGGKVSAAMTAGYTQLLAKF